MASQLGDMVVRIVGDNADLDKSIDSSQKKLTDFGASAKKIGANLSLFVTAPLLAIGIAAVKSSANMEMLEASFETMLGSAQKASILMANLKDLAASTPFEVNGLAEASKTLLQFGIENEKVIPTLQQLGDISGGNSAKLQSLALVFGQIQSTGKLMGQDLLQLINAGFNPLQVISEKTGKSMSFLKDEMSKGRISAVQVSEAFKIATSEGGRFFNGMAVASRTLTGLTSTLRDDLGALGRSFVEDLVPIIKDMVKWLSSLAQYFTGLDKNTKQTILIIAGFTAILGPAISGVSALTGVIAGLNGILAINPIVAVTTALVALGATAALVGNNIKNLQERQKTLNDILKGGTTGNFAKDLELVNEEISNINAQIGSSTGLFEGENDELNKQLEILKQVATQIGMKVQGQRTGRTLAIDDAKLSADAAALAERRLKIEEQYKKSRELVVKTLEDEKSEYQKIQDQINQLQNTPWAKGELENQRLAALQALRNKQIDIINEASARLAEAEKENTSVIQTEAGKRALALAQQENSRLAKIEEFNNLSKTSSQLRIEQIEKEKQAFISAGISEVEAARWANQEIINLRLNQFSQILSLTGSFVSQLQSLYQMDVQNRLDAINAKLAADLAALDEQLEAALEAAGLAEETEKEKQTRILQELKDALAAAKTAEEKAALEEAIREAEKALKKAEIIEEFNEEKDKLEKEAALATYKIEKEAFETNKKFSIVQTIIDTLEMAVKAYKALAGIPIVGPALGAAAAAAALAFGNAKVSAIRDQVGPQPPALADGGIIMPRNGGVNTIMAEAGQPEVAIPLDRLGEVLNTFNKNIDSGSDMTQLTVNIDSEPIFSKIFDATKSKRILISADAVVES